MHWMNGLVGVMILVSISACGGGGNNDNNNVPEPETPGVGKLVISDATSADNRQLPVVGVTYATELSEPVQQRGASTNAAGEFEYLDAESVTFNLLGQTFGPIAAKSVITQDDLAASYCHDAETPIECNYQASKNIQRMLLSIDKDEDFTNGIMPGAGQTAFPVAPDTPIDEFEVALAKKLLPRGRQVAALFRPLLGINLEEAQPEADDVGGQPVPFVDLFRVARPFPEYSCKDIVYDEQGWPQEIPDSCNDQENNANAIFNFPTYALTFMLREVPLGSIPTGKYTVLYEGSGTLEYYGIGSKVTAESVAGRDIIEVTDTSIKERAGAGLRIRIKDIVKDQPVRNIRVVMPGGICEGNPFWRVESADECPAGQAYQSFVDTLDQDRNAIVFNPDFMRFLKDFKVIRTMNFMKASPRNPCYTLKDEAYFECLLQEFTWAQRAKLDDAMWGGSFRTDLAERANRGVPLEVTVALGNQLQRDLWFNIPHNADDDYVKKYATYVRDHLDPKLKAYVEYTNEPWNHQFWGALYTIEKGKEAGLGTSDYWAGLYYYTERSVEVFNIWHDLWGGAERLVRVLNTQHNGGQFASRNMLNHKGASQSVDAIASAPYFYGCWDRANVRCQDETKVPLLMTEVTSVDEVFEVIDNADDPYGMAQTIAATQGHANFAEEFGVDLISYEGGQHLTVHWGDGDLENARKHSLLDLFRAANRDPRMAERYKQLLEGWKEHGGDLFTLYTMPQTYHTFGSFGIKEHLGQKRKNAPKYDASMQFQEEQRICWWEGCE